MRRVSIVGNSGSGKTWLGHRLAEALGVPHFELDAFNHLPGWRPADVDAFLASVSAAASADAWVIDGNYTAAVADGPVWNRADTVVWVDLPRYVVMYQVISRTLRRVIRREELWNGNRERWRNLWAWDPEESVIRWSWTQHARYRRLYEAAMASPTNAHLRFVRLRSRAEVERWLEECRRS